MTDNQTPEPVVDEEGTQMVSTPTTNDEKGVTPTDTPEGSSAITEESEVFPAEYVRRLRREAADNRVKAKRADELAAEVWALKVAATGRLADPSDLPYQPDTDPLQAIDDLLQTKPHLARRTPRGDVGQGATATAPAVSLIDMLR